MTAKDSRRVGALAVAILAFALAARVGYVLATPGYVPHHDDHAYDHLAIGIARTGAFPAVGHRPSAYRPPGYPYVLGGIYAFSGTGHARIITARLLQAVLGTGIVALLGVLAFRLFGRVAALCTMAIAAVYVPLVAVGASLLSEPQSAALGLAALVTVLKWRHDGGWRWVILTGVLGGALTLTRANAFVFLIALAVGLWIGRPRVSFAAWAPAAAMLATTAIVVAPWTIRNAVVLHSFIPVSDEAGGTLAGTYNPVSAGDSTAPASWHLLAQIPDYQTRTQVVATGPEPQLQSALLHLALGYAADHPFYPAKVAYFNTVRLLDLGGLGRARSTAASAGINSAVADLGVFCFWIVLATSLGACLLRVVRRGVPLFVWLGVALLFVSIVFVSTETPRFRVPLDPFVILIAGAGAAVVVERVRIRGTEASAHGARPRD